MWIPVIGLEVHARLLTRTKIFCRCSTVFGAPPNSQVCPICLGYPGALPQLNREAVRLAVRMALATGCTVHPESIFARKNYFYPDLPKGYQITQYDRPLATNGSIPISTSSGKKSIRIHRIHLEEDAGKLLHDTPYDDVPNEVSLVDLNRAGIPLIEIVSEPDVASAEEAVAYLTRLRQILTYTGVCDGNMEEGSLRCDANISVHRADEPWGTRVEVKNLNSFRFVGRAIDFEIGRQIGANEGAERIVQETRLYDVAAGETRAMRSKEEAHDYRYFPEPDLPPLRLEREWVEQIRSEIPPLPQERLASYQERFGVTPADAEVLVSSRELADYFEAVVEISHEPRAAANWVRNEVLGVINERRIAISEFPLRPSALARLIALVSSGAIGGKTAKEVFEEIAATGESPEAVVERRGLGQISDPVKIREAAERVIAGSGEQLAKYHAGKKQLFGYFVGQVMKELQGRANAELANQIVRELID